MSLFQCENCGCVENTALSSQGFSHKFLFDCFDWSGIEHLKGMKLCTACGPIKHSDGTPTDYAGWHGQFKQRYLEKGKYKTNAVGNLEHIETGEEIS